MIPKRIITASHWAALLALVAALLLAPYPVLADAPLVTRFSDEGNYAIVADGAGMEETPVGNITLDIPGTPVQAYLYWAGFDTQTGGVDTLTFTRDNDPATTTTVTADMIFGPDYWFGGPPPSEERHHFVYEADVTAFMLTGTHTYTVTDFSPILRSYGAGLVVVYEDPTLPLNQVVIRDGLDSFFEGFPAPRGPDSEVNCFEFDPAPTDRVLSYNVMVAGVATTTEERPIALWAQTGNGALPTNLVNQPDAIEVDGPPAPYPFFNFDGREWDTYTNTLTVPANDTYACLQIESVPDIPNLLGASGVWLTLSGTLEAAPQTVLPSDTPTVTPVPATATPVPTAPPAPTATPVSAAPQAAGQGQPPPAPTAASAGEIPFPTRLPATGYPPVERAAGWLLVGLGILAIAVAVVTLRRH